MANTSNFPSIASTIRTLTVARGHVGIFALGQHGFVLKGQHTTIVIDPYLTDYVDEAAPAARLKRGVPIVMQPHEMDMIDYALITHEHGDHADPRTLLPMLKAAPQAYVFTSWRTKDMLVNMDFDGSRISVPAVDKAVRVNDEFTFTPIPAAHYTQDLNADGNPAYLGFIIQLNGVTLYHAGDTVMYPGLLARVQGQGIDIAFLPINGSDWFREQNNITGNLDYREASIFNDAIGAKVFIPAHNDLFASNAINPAVLVDFQHVHYPHQRMHFLRAGELYYFAG